MKSIQKLIASVFMLCLFVNLLSAQPGRGGMRGGSPEERAERQTKQLTEQLSLSEAQAEKVKALNLKYGKKMQEARANAGDDRSGMREIMQGIRTEQNQELKKYLTADQFTKYEGIQAERRAKRGQGAPGKRGKRGKKKEMKKALKEEGVEN